MVARNEIPSLNPAESAFFDSLNINIAVLDQTGTIIAVNEAWKRFGLQNGGNAQVQQGVGLNYFAICEAAVGENSEEAQAAKEGIQNVLNGSQDSFVLEFPCHAPEQKCWFLLTASSLATKRNHAVIFYTDITVLKLQTDVRLIRTAKSHKRQLLALTLRLAETEELQRKKLASELHDQVGQTLSALGINLNVIRSYIPPENNIKPLSMIDDSLVLIEDAVERTRDIMSELRPPVLDDFGLLAALKWVANRYAQRTDLDIQVEGDAKFPELPIYIESALFHISQEALLNVVKHANAKKIHVLLTAEKKEVRLTIEDDGEGFVPLQSPQPDQEPTWGLLSIHERAEAIGGQVFINSTPGKGTKITIEVSL